MKLFSIFLLNAFIGFASVSTQEPTELLATELIATNPCDWCVRGEVVSELIGAGIFVFGSAIAITILIIKRPDTELLGFHITLLVNLFILNAVYIVFAIPYSYTDFTLKVALAFCESVGVLLHFHFIATFSIIFCMALWLLAKLNKVFENPTIFTVIACVIQYLSAAVIVLICVVIPSGTNPLTKAPITIDKYVSAQLRCWLNDSYVAFAAVPAGLLFVLSIALIVYAYTVRKQFYEENKFIFTVTIPCLVFAALVWIFAFLPVMKTPTDTLYLNIAFGVVYCFLNTCFAIFVVYSAIVLAKTGTKRVMSAPKSEA